MWSKRLLAAVLLIASVGSAVALSSGPDAVLPGAQLKVRSADALYERAEVVDQVLEPRHNKCSYCKKVKNATVSCHGGTCKYSCKYGLKFNKKKAKCLCKGKKCPEPYPAHTGHVTCKKGKCGVKCPHGYHVGGTPSSPSCLAGGRM